MQVVILNMFHDLIFNEDGILGLRFSIKPGMTKIFCFNVEMIICFHAFIVPWYNFKVKNIFQKKCRQKQKLP
ncbi:MAG: hypothetical protein UY41_C0010G0015 [Candidatus Moranbacteria bacterium GW2011_GWE1_49_15]|nr:MAG: hypothetical protein UX75_C0031G0015 [Candidatus Moranbacteria bacterium GW2011_GWE2_47_10]KKW07026.1 MAG: hypothetical protein UY41_C0010G0015 [Candidatus Moranbacteria bacterium GW2011_GWE1_49_15]HBP01499.1 hypothetical protein [Candidatus Moranbacteria bacterium]